jgi:hypothetical protein
VVYSKLALAQGEGVKSLIKKFGLKTRFEFELANPKC